MKKILFIADYFPNEKNSVAEALNSLIENVGTSNYKMVVLKATSFYSDFIEKSTIGEIVCYGRSVCTAKAILKSKNISIKEKVKYLFKKIGYFIKGIFIKKSVLQVKEREKILKKIVKREKIDLIFSFTSPYNWNNCSSLKIPYLYMLYDTYITDPIVDRRYCFALERHIIDNSKGYFVPHFFYEDYLKIYGENNFIKYNFPALISKEKVLQAYNSVQEKYGFAYFGQVQSFRNADKIEHIFKSLNLKLEVFTHQRDLVSDAFSIHKPLSGEDLYNSVASSRYLVVFDNSAPYENYLPSKVYLYVSFTKPIIIFGDNKDSATIRFFKDYPNCYYQNINEPLDGLKDFLNKDFKDEFDEEIYKNYLDYLPENAVKPIIEKINEILK